MSTQYIGFNENFYTDILSGEKTKTLRYQMAHRLPSEGDIVSAVISHDDGPFAKLEITDVYTMTAREIIETTFEQHQNYDSFDHFKNRMNEYYDASEFSLDTEFDMIEFEVVEQID